MRFPGPHSVFWARVAVVQREVMNAGSSELSLEERLLRERQRMAASGITSFEYVFWTVTETDQRFARHWLTFLAGLCPSYQLETR